jgi:hypothetical protein
MKASLSPRIASSSEPVPKLQQRPQALCAIAGKANNGAVVGIGQGVALRSWLDVIARRRPIGKRHRLPAIWAGRADGGDQDWPR